MENNNVNNYGENARIYDASQPMPQQVAWPMQQPMPQPVQNVCRPTNCDYDMSITSFSDLQSYSRGAVVRFPDFAEGQPFVARVRRPSMLVLAKSGKIPNSLLVAAGELFSKGGGGVDTDNENMLSDIYGICEVVAKATLIQPTYDEIKNAGMELSDDQMMAIFNYSQSGVKALEPFCQK